MATNLLDVRPGCPSDCASCGRSADVVLLRNGVVTDASGAQPAHLPHDIGVEAGIDVRLSPIEFGMVVVGGLLARYASTLGDFVAHVVEMRSSESVIGANARRVIAVMEHEYVNGQRPVDGLTHETVGAEGGIPYGESPVAAAIACASPFPAVAAKVDLRPKAVEYMRTFTVCSPVAIQPDVVGVAQLSTPWGSWTDAPYDATLQHVTMIDEEV